MILVWIKACAIRLRLTICQFFAESRQAIKESN